MSYPIPTTHPVQPIHYGDLAGQRAATSIATCGECGRIWDDGKVTSLTPMTPWLHLLTPSARCPFEQFHDDDQRDSEWTEYQCHFEVIVNTDAAGTVSPRAYLNDENSASWWDGTVYATNDDGDGEWISSDDAPADDDAGRHLGRVLALPDRIMDIYRLHTSGDGWDINIMSDIAALMVELGYTSPELTDTEDEDVELTCDTCGRIGNTDDWIEAGGPCQEPCDGIVRRVDDR